MDTARCNNHGMTNPTPTQKTRSSVECPACSSREARATLADLSVYVCGRCGCLHGTTYLGSSYSFILPRMTSSVEGVAEFPYDLTTLGSAGVSRRHGFYQPSTKLVTQVG